MPEQASSCRELQSISTGLVVNLRRSRHFDPLSLHDSPKWSGPGSRTRTGFWEATDNEEDSILLGIERHLSEEHEALNACNGTAGVVRGDVSQDKDGRRCGSTNLDARSNKVQAEIGRDPRRDVETAGRKEDRGPTNPEDGRGTDRHISDL
jgi:hypothetical protein